MKNVLNIFRNTKKIILEFCDFFSSLFYDTRVVNHHFPCRIPSKWYSFTNIFFSENHKHVNVHVVSDFFFRFSFFRQYLMINSQIATIKKLKTKTKIEKKIRYHMYIDISAISRKIMVSTSDAEA